MSVCYNETPDQVAELQNFGGTFGVFIANACMITLKYPLTSALSITLKQYGTKRRTRH